MTAKKSVHVHVCIHVYIYIYYVFYGKKNPYANKCLSYAGELCAIVMRNSYMRTYAPRLRVLCALLWAARTYA